MLITPSFVEAGAFAARRLMADFGHPDSVLWFNSNAPDLSDPKAVAQTNRPVEFWRSVRDEIMSVGGTA